MGSVSLTSDGSVIVCGPNTASSGLYSLNPASGALQWKVTQTSYCSDSSVLIDDTDRAFFGTFGGQLVAVACAPAAGTPLWTNTGYSQFLKDTPAMSPSGTPACRLVVPLSLAHDVCVSCSKLSCCQVCWLSPHTMARCTASTPQPVHSCGCTRCPVYWDTTSRSAAATSRLSAARSKLSPRLMCPRDP